MGIAPLQFAPGYDRKTLRATGADVLDLTRLGEGLRPLQTVYLIIRRTDGSVETAELICRIDTDRELAWYRGGGILPLAMRNLADRRAA